jgi:hypothetical protein
MKFSFHVMIFLSHILHWPFPSIDFYIAKKIFELTNCENKSLRELTLFESGFKNISNNVFFIWVSVNIVNYHIFCGNMFVFACSIIANSQCWLFALIYSYLSSLVSKIYQTMSILTMMLETFCKIYPRRWHLNGNSYSTRLLHVQ